MATPATQFSLFGAGGDSILTTQFPGPKFELAGSMVLTELGGFVTTFALPATVQIVPARSDGSPDGTNVLARYVLSSDGDPLTYSYESVAPNLRLAAGPYFALFGVQDDDFGILLGNASSPFAYQAGLTPAGYLDPTTGQASASPAQFMAVRILARESTAAELLADLAGAARGLGPGTSLSDKVAEAQESLAADDIRETCSILSAFIRETNAQSGKSISIGQAAELITATQEIKTKLGC